MLRFNTFIRYLKGRSPLRLGAIGVICLIGLITITKVFNRPKTIEHTHKLPHVYATPMKAVSEIITIRSSGVTKASRKINILSETSGQIYRLYHKKGNILNSKDTIASIQLNDRAQQLKEAKAAYNLAKEKLEVTQTLAKGNFRSSLNLKAAQVDYESASARLARIEKDIENTKIMAPFKGVLGDIFLEEGSVVPPGAVIATLLNLDPILIQVYISEKDYKRIALNSEAIITFYNDYSMKGKILFVSSIADPKTHMFLLEISIDNLNFKIPQGATAKVRIPTTEQKVHKISPSILSLDQGGNMVVKVVNAENKVESYPVALVQSDGDTLWVTGLPEEAVIINYGGHFVNVGDTVQWDHTDKLKGSPHVQ